jgi:predicted nuclease with TOPRIM domain
VDISKEQLDQEEKEANGRLQSLANGINQNVDVIQQLKEENGKLAEEARRVEGEIRHIKNLKERLNGAKPKKEEQPK